MKRTIEKKKNKKELDSLRKIKTSIITLELKVPFVEAFIDYHDIPELEETLCLLFKTNKIKIKEVAFDGLYWAVYYTRGNKPSKQEIKDMLIAAGFHFINSDSAVY